MLFRLRLSICCCSRKEETDAKPQAVRHSAPHFRIRRSIDRHSSVRCFQGGHWDGKRGKRGLTPGLLSFPVSVLVSHAGASIAETRTDTDNNNGVGVSPRFCVSGFPVSWVVIIQIIAYDSGALTGELEGHDANFGKGEPTPIRVSKTRNIRLTNSRRQK